MGLGVEFEEPYIPPKLRPPEKSSGSITNLFIKIGLGKNVNDAKKAMLVTAAGAFLVSLYFFTHLGTPNRPLTPEQLDMARAQLEGAASASK